MSLEAKLFVAVCVGAIAFAMGAVVLRRMIRGEPFRKQGTTPLMPPSGPSIDGGGPPPCP